MTLKPHFIIICDQAFLSAGSNNLNIIGIFTQINANKFPFTYPRFSLVVNFDSETPGKHKLHTEIIDPSGKSIAHTELPVSIAPGNMQVIATFENMQFSAPGQYAIKITLDGQPLGQRAILVNPIVSSHSEKTNLA